jgi:hypothetical protein
MYAYIHTYTHTYIQFVVVNVRLGAGPYTETAQRLLLKYYNYFSFSRR